MEAVATVASGLLALLGTVVGVGARLLVARMKSIETKHDTLAEAFGKHTVEVPKTYVLKEDYKDAVLEIKAGITEIRRYVMGDRDGR